MIHFSLNIDFSLAKSADPDEMPPYAAFHLGLHCLPKYLFIGIKNEKGYGVPCQVWYLIVSIPDRCLHLFFNA